MLAMKNQERRCPISNGSQVASYACSLRMSSRSSDLRPGEATLRDTAAAPAVEPVRTLMRPRGRRSRRAREAAFESARRGLDGGRLRAGSARACRLRRFGPYRCGSGSSGGPRPSMAPYVTGPKKVRSLPEATDFRGTRSKSQIPPLFPHRFPVNSRALPSVEGLWDKMRLTRRFRRRLPRR